MEWKTTDVLAVLTIAGGVISFSWNAYKDRDVKISEHANKVRGAAAQLLGKTNALRGAVPASVLEAQERVVETKLRLLENYEPKKAMHGLWGTILNSEAKALARVASLQTDPAYLQFYTFNPNTKKCLDKAIESLESEIRTGYATVLTAIEQARIDLPADKKLYIPAQLYNKVALPLQEMERNTASHMVKLLGPIESHLIAVIARGNDLLTAESLQREVFACSLGDHPIAR